MKKSSFLFLIGFLCIHFSDAQQKATIREYNKTFTTYPFSDPDPVPDMSKIYPYYRFDGYTDQPIQKEWKVVELENDFIKVMILPEVGGKVWSAIEKSTGKAFIYYNQVVKFRDVAMRGPWTSGGLEANYGIIGHTPNCATPVDYVSIEKKDGSVSCVIGVLDLLTRTTWRIDINLQRDKAFFTTSSLWQNSSEFEQPYYTWMNTGIKAKGNLEFIYPGTKYIGHEGEIGSWPVNPENGKNVAFYENNNFGTYKSYHVFGKYTDFFGGYWHDEDFGMGRYSTRDDKPGKKIWIWGLSQQGMIWEKLLTDSDGQYVEVQSGRLFNQASEGSSLTPFKHTGFLPHSTDVWTEYWFPVLNTKGFVAANDYGALNIKKEDGWIKIYFSGLQAIKDELKIMGKGNVVYSKSLQLQPLQLFMDSVKLQDDSDIVVTLGNNKLKYESASSANVMNRPVESPKNFDWNAVYGLSIKAKENIRQRYYHLAEADLKACLSKDPDYVPALTDYAMLMYRNRKYKEALELAVKALSIDTYDPAANYYYGLINNKQGNMVDAKDGFEIAAMQPQFRSASYIELAKIYFRQNDLEKAMQYAKKCTDLNQPNIESLQLLAVIARMENKGQPAAVLLDSILTIDPLNHFARFEKYLGDDSENNRKQFTDLIKNEMPAQTFLELATWYHNLGKKEETIKLLLASPKNDEVNYWISYLQNTPLKINEPVILAAFPFRPETADVLEKLIEQHDHWLLKYHLALIHWQNNNLAAAKILFDQCAQQSKYAPFYAARARFYKAEGSTSALNDLQYATQLDKNEWRYGRALAQFYLDQKQNRDALATAAKYSKQFPKNYILGMQYIRVLLLNEKFGLANTELQTIKILPNEGATDGRQLYKEIQLMLALDAMENKQHKKALSFVAAAKQWPENLGVGKPYQNDIDERLEDWLNFQNYTRLNNKVAAQQSLDKIINFTSSIQKNNASSANNLVSAWAMRQKGNQQEGEQFLEQLLKKDPKDVTGNWALNAYKGQPLNSVDEKYRNENFRVLEKLFKITEKR